MKRSVSTDSNSDSDSDATDVDEPLSLPQAGGTVASELVKAVTAPGAKLVFRFPRNTNQKDSTERIEWYDNVLTQFCGDGVFKYDHVAREYFHTVRKVEVLSQFRIHNL
jgi:hypothetical protein